MKYKDCLECLDTLKQIKTPSIAEVKDFPNGHLMIPSAKFLYAVAKNKRALEAIKSDCDTIKEPSEAYIKFEQGREEILQKHAKKDDKGQFQLIREVGPDGQPRAWYDIEGVQEPTSKFRKEMDKFLEEQKVVMEEQEDKIKKYNEHLLKESEFEPFKIKEVDIPMGLSEKVWDALFHLIDMDN
jgi:hypothetical protein